MKQILEAHYVKTTSFDVPDETQIGYEDARMIVDMREDKSTNHLPQICDLTDEEKVKHFIARQQWLKEKAQKQIEELSKNAE